MQQQCQLRMQKCSSLPTGIRGHIGHVPGRRLAQVTALASKSEPISAPSPPFKVLITGSTKGVGRALAEEFLQSGDTVYICSRSEERVSSTVAELRQKHGESRVQGSPVDVSKPAEVRSLAERAVAEMGRVDIWINNAGTNGYRYGSMLDSSDDELVSIVETNMLGVMLCCREAVRVMRQQRTCAHVFNMDGAGADGNPTPRFAAYGATKRGLAQLGSSLREELKSEGVSHVGIHDLSPGMVTTELLMTGADTAASKFFINCLAEPPEEVASFLVPRVREVAATSAAAMTGGQQPSYVRYLTKPKAYSQIFKRLLTGERKDRFVSEAT